jgi:diguanylate cyclase (GGDEF)-like protein/PAS domain S-box-containing protein
VYALQAIIVNIAVLGLLILLFGATFWVRPDDRLRCWVVAWLCVLTHFASELFNPASVVWSQVRDCAGVDALALAGIFLIVSTMVLTEGRKAAMRLGLLLTVLTLPLLSLASIRPWSAWLLSLLVLTRQATCIALAARARSNHRFGAAAASLVFLVSGSWMIYGTVTGQAEIVVSALLAEVFLVTAIEFRRNGWGWTMALRTMLVGLVAWAAVFPASLLVSHLWPQFVLNPEVWNIPKFCVAVGMILVVMEEDTRGADALAGEYRLLFESNPHPLWIFDNATLQLLNVNQAALDKHGYTREEFLELKLPDILSPSALPLALQDAVSLKPMPNRVLRHVRKDGSILPMDVTAHDIAFMGRSCRLAMGIDVTEREKLEQQLLHQWQHDSLTGLPNRMLFQKLLAEAVPAATQAEQKLAIVCLDIRRFKRVNDTYGPRVADECLRRVGAILSAHVRPMDFVARTAGEEFALVLTGIKSAAMVEQAVSELREILAQPLLIEGYKVQLGFSMGLAVCPDDGSAATALWRGAERALRQAQDAGGGQTVWLSPELSHDAEEQIELEAYMRLQLEEGGFHLAYQPFYAFDGTVLGMEALLRLEHPRLGEVSPVRLIPIAEETGLIIPLGQWVLEEVCRQVRTWNDQGMRLVPVAVNVSGLQLMRLDFAARVMETLRRHNVDPRWIHLEVTETVAMRNLADVSERMLSLTAQGIAFSIDDFGTGHSSLGRLHQLPISVLKIDQSFIEQLCQHNGTYSIVQAVISMAHALGLNLVAEGVETAGQLDCLRALQCDRLQGFLLSRPVPPGQIPALIANPHLAFSHVSSAERLSPLLPFDPEAILVVNAGGTPAAESA